jgi:hypothetical protein
LVGGDMTEEQLKQLFTLEEFNKFCEFMIEMDHSWSRNSCYTEYIQEYLTRMEDNERKEEIIYSCIRNYPHILGIESEFK